MRQSHRTAKAAQNASEGDLRPILVLATQNPGKLKEMQALLGSAWTGKVEGAANLNLSAPDETSESFEGNARIKAEATCRATGTWALADDSGLCVDCLGGLPGVDTAHYGGHLKLLAAMEGVPPDRRQAHFVCVLALARPGTATVFFHGRVDGYIAITPRGEGGFGYDPVFVPGDEARTFAEMTAAEKAQYSHRARAFAALRDWLESQERNT